MSRPITTGQAWWAKCENRAWWYFGNMPYPVRDHRQNFIFETIHERAMACARLAALVLLLFAVDEHCWLHAWLGQLQ